MDKLLTKKELAEHWQVNQKSIDNWVKEGRITPCKKVPGDMRFNPQYIAKLDETELNPLSPFERRRLERKLKEVSKERDYYKSIVAEMDVLTSKVRAEYLNAKEGE